MISLMSTDKVDKQHGVFDPEDLKCATLTRGRVLLSTGPITSFPVAERLRMIRAKIERANLRSNQYQVIAVSSALPQEGKSVNSVNLARALGIDPQGKTLLIDCDLRKPSAHKFFGQSVHPGLSDTILGNTPAHEVVRSIGPGLDFIAAGTPSFDPTQVIEQPRFVELINKLRSRYRYIVLDCPPVLLCSEPITIAGIADGMIMVIRAWRTEKRLLNDSLDQLGRRNVFGIILNEGNEVSRQYSYYSYYGYRTDAVPKGRKALPPADLPPGGEIK